MILAATALVGESGSATVTSIRFWSLGEVTRVVVETSGEARFRSEKLDQPERLFFDIYAIYPRRPRILAVGDKLVRQIRVAGNQRNVTRVVFDLETHVEFSSSQLTNPDRLIIELRNPDAPRPAGSPDTPVASAGPAPAVSPRPAAAPAPVSVPAARSRFIPPAAPLEARVPPSLAPLPAPPHVRSTAAPLPAPTLALAIANPGRRPAAAPTPRAAGPVPAAGPKPAAAAAEHAAAAGSLAGDPLEAPSPARGNSLGGRSMTRVLGLKIGRIVLDPGHGGHDHGSTGPTGLAEKDLVLEVAQRLQGLIEERLGSEVVLTRTDDTYVPLEQRTALANEKHADLFLSIHANSSPLRAASGVETYYLNFTTSRDALELAARENATSQKSVFELRDLLHRIALKDKVDESRELASRVQTALIAATGKTTAGARNRGIKRAPFVVLIGASMPSILAEIGFLSNPRDEALLKKPEQRQRIAEALYKGLAQYVSTLSHFQVARKVPRGGN